MLFIVFVSSRSACPPFRSHFVSSIFASTEIERGAFFHCLLPDGAFGLHKILPSFADCSPHSFKTISAILHKKIKNTGALTGKRGRGSVALSGALLSTWPWRSPTGILMNGPGAETWSGFVLRGGEDYEETAASRGGGMSSRGSVFADVTHRGKSTTRAAATVADHIVTCRHISLLSQH